jgi:hypothetical protein
LKSLQKQRCFDAGKHHVQVPGMTNSACPVHHGIWHERAEAGHEPIAQPDNAWRFIVTFCRKDSASFTEAYA